MKIRHAIVAVAAIASSVAFAEPTAEHNGIITDAAGKTLYTFDKDSADKSACNGGCAAAWPPFFAAQGAKPQGDLGLAKRDDGALQWTFKSRPLYYFAGDAKPFEKNGDGQGGVWHVVQSGKPAKAAAGAPGGYSNYGY